MHNDLGPPHGTLAGYLDPRFNCRCILCRSAYQAAYDVTPDSEGAPSPRVTR